MTAEPESSDQSAGDEVADGPPPDPIPTPPDSEPPKRPKRPLPPRKQPTKKQKQIEDQLAELTVSRAEADVLSAHADVHDKRTRTKQAGREHGLLLLLRGVLGLAGLGIVVWWQSALLSIVERQGKKELDIPVSVLLALVTTTTVNVFGFLLIVYRFVFPQPPKAEPRSRKPKR